ncbi:MAG: hypothetical protein JNJ77_08000 [Planctomycetia bacterium]|nr:hypothetical protein [Planctomycetia bacterium]
MSDQMQFNLINFGLQLPIGFITLMLAILAAHFWTASGSFPFVRTLLVTVMITVVFALPSLWSWPTFFSSPLSLAAAFYLPFWLSAIWFGYRLDVKEAWTIITIHWPIAIGVMFFIYLPICWSIEREYEEKQRQRRRDEIRLVISNRDNCTASTNHRYLQTFISGSRTVAPPV